MKQRPRILLVFHSAHSTGSAVARSFALIDNFEERFELLALIPEPGIVSEALEERGGISVLYGSLHENNGIFGYLYHFFRFCLLLFRQRIVGIQYMDFGWWKPAEIIAAKLLGVKQIALIAFYRPEFAKAGFLRLVDKIIPNSERTAADFYQHGLRDKTKVVYNFVESSRYDEAPSIKAEFCPPTENLLGYVGVLHSIKGIDSLLKAMPAILEKHPNSKLLLVGKEKEDGVEDSLKNLVSELNLSEFVVFLGYRSDIPELMKSFDLLFVPSLEEPFGFVNIEAGAAGTAVIASRIGGIPEIIEDEKEGLLVTPGSSEEIAAAAIRLLDNSEERESYAAALRSKVGQSFSRSTVLADWDSVWEQTFL